MVGYIKVDDKNATLETTIVTIETINIDKLVYDRDSLIRTQEDNIAQNLKIQVMIDDLNEKIQELKTLGLVETIPSEPNTDENPNEG